MTRLLRFLVATALLPSAVITTTAVAQPSQRVPLLWGKLHPGPHTHIGFMVVAGHDTRVSIWYPAAKAGRPMSLGNYLEGDKADFIQPYVSAGIASSAMQALLGRSE